MAEPSATQRVTREQVLSVIRERFPAEPFSTREIAAALGRPEYAVRGVAVWLKAGAVITEGPTVRRVDRAGRPYPARTYTWSGQTEIRRVVADPQSRRLAKEQDQAAPARALAASWLSRRW